jgi:hypothetical protein
MTIFECVVRWLHKRPIMAGNYYDPGNMEACSIAVSPVGFAGVRCWRTRAGGRWLTATITFACPHHPGLSSLAAPAFIDLACLHCPEKNSVLVVAYGLQLWLSALSFPSLSFVYQFIVFALFG